MKRKLTGLLILVFATLLLSAGDARSQVVIYKLDFQKTGSSINFSFFEEGLLILPALGGTGTLILSDQTGGRREYVIAQDSARLFVAEPEG